MTDSGTATDAGIAVRTRATVRRLAYILIAPLPWLEKRCLDS